MISNQSTSSSLSLNGLQLSVFIGIYPEERIKKQTVTLDVRLGFSVPPKACLSDQLADTYCYDKLITHLKEKLTTKKYQLIEHLTKEVYELLKNYFPPTITLSVRVTKLPDVADLSGGVTFEYGSC